MPFWGFLAPIPDAIVWLLVVCVALALGYAAVSLRGWALLVFVLLYGAGAHWLIWIIALTVFASLLIPMVRVQISRHLLHWLKSSGFLPRISETERAALEAGTVWIEGDLFSGRPDFRRLQEQTYPDLTPDEEAFLNGPVKEVCQMVDDWEVAQRRDLPPEVWEYLKRERFFGMIIPKEYGGLGFSALANSAVVQKLTSRSLPLGITVMVPNSLGPAELLLHYGTQRQRQYYLPRLARGEEIPCFALTEPTAGSDAAAISSHGLLFRDDDGEMQIRLNWEKRYITLAAVSTLLGVAFRLYDPERLLGGDEDVGITCALVPATSRGVVLGRRHDPLGVAFINAPTEGRDVIVSAEAIIGGVDGAGRGWRMLMESLAAGRGISLPAQACAGAKLVTRVATAHAFVRKQFGLPLGRFEGIEALLARIGGMTYLMDASRVYTCGGLAAGAKPAVATAILKYQTTEIQRELINHGMDILGGNGISRGPRNLLASAYAGAPIGITVEGANVLTRTLIIFGQGAIRCHPHAYKVIGAILRDDVVTFDRQLWAHIGHLIRNGCRALVLSLSRGYVASIPSAGRAGRYYRRLAWASASFAFWADVTMMSMGGTLKRREQISGRFADILSWMFLAAAALKRYEAEGGRSEMEPFMHYALQSSLGQIQRGFDELFANLRVAGLTTFIRGPIAMWSRLNPIGRPPNDRLSSEIAQSLQVPGGVRDRLVAGTFVSEDEADALSRLERAFVLAHDAETALRKIKDAGKSGELPIRRPEDLRSEALSAGVISEAEYQLIDHAEAARAEYIRVDSFAIEDYIKGDLLSPIDKEALGRVQHTLRVPT